MMSTTKRALAAALLILGCAEMKPETLHRVVIRDHRIVLDLSSTDDYEAVVDCLDHDGFRFPIRSRHWIGAVGDTILIRSNKCWGPE